MVRLSPLKRQHTSLLIENALSQSKNENVRKNCKLMKKKFLESFTFGCFEKKKKLRELHDLPLEVWRLVVGHI